MEVEFQSEPSCLGTHELSQSDSCADHESAGAIADAIDNAAMALRSSLQEIQLHARFSMSGDDGFTAAEPHAADFELLSDGRQSISSRHLRTG